ncbi:MAG: aminotransferase class I/II-fold pyridoxal phosphate-dependent enzyme, partial [Haliea sp.]
TGATIFASANPASSLALRSQAQVAARRIYSMPPAHGALLAGRVLADDELNANWQDELQAMCRRINGLRTSLMSKLEQCTDRDFGFIEREKGMFSFLGLSREQAVALREEHSVYMLESSRINVAGVNGANIDYLAEAVGKVLLSH